MPRFLSRTNDLVISTSYKVMYSTLVASPDLCQIAEREARRLLRRATPPRHVVLARNPYDRLRSFYRDKLFQDLNGREKAPFQWCQRAILRRLGLWPFGSYDRKLAALKSLTFKDFLGLLPSVVGNGHLRPQVSLLTSGRQPLPPPDVVHRIEDGLDVLIEMAPLFANLGRANVTHDRVMSLPIEGRALINVNRLYAQDFWRFGYLPQPDRTRITRARDNATDEGSPCALHW
ncbi:hypothetical protein GCM10007385_39610 [Tateyamaria omphalii]|uniref:sulfotransferase family 2 domain-containing protein n=1 Tax=Tateyamaria omphalii TaxID=299262 RepID=UPI0016752005|nr:sulfotransferase family 2 domain-containing protein [Tateyamaria omphalii]GGX66641.1 hypothetical protein GCM10007385_39610 [Tateyamaria omphalii]